MNSRLLRICAATLLAYVAFPGIGAAVDNCTGHYVNVGSKSISISNDPTEPSHVLIGECREGRCVRRDADGDEMTLEHKRGSGDYLAQWKVVSGTGKYVTTKRSGWYRPTRVDGDVVVGDWGGNCQ